MASTRVGKGAAYANLSSRVSKATRSLDPADRFLHSMVRALALRYLKRMLST